MGQVIGGVGRDGATTLALNGKSDAIVGLDRKSETTFVEVDDLPADFTRILETVDNIDGTS